MTKPSISESLSSIDTLLEISKAGLRDQWQQYYLAELGCSIDEIDDAERYLLECKIATKVRHHIYPPHRPEISPTVKQTAEPAR
jgi:hypothetical protein